MRLYRSMRFFLTKSPVSKPSSRPYLLKYGAPCWLPRRHRSIHSTFQTRKNMCKMLSFMASFLVSSSHETFVKGNDWFRGRGGRRISHRKERSCVNRYDLNRGRRETTIATVLRSRTPHKNNVCAPGNQPSSGDNS